MTVTKQLIDNVNKIKTTLNEISVYNLDVKTAIELYYELAKKVNEVINELSRFEGVVSDEVIKQNEKLIYLLGEGLKEQVVIKIDNLIKDGTIQDLINNKIFNDLNNKIDTLKQEVNEQFNTIEYEKLSNIDFEKRINQIASGSPKGVYSTLSELQKAKPTGDTGIYITTDNGNWNYWDGSSWKAGGVYNSLGLADNSVTEKKTTFARKSKNLFNINTITNNKKMDSAGTITDNDEWVISEYIKVEQGKQYKPSASAVKVLYNSNFEYVTGYGNSSDTFTTVNNTSYVRLCIHKSVLPDFQFEQNNITTSYEQYGVLIDDLIADVDVKNQVSICNSKNNSSYNNKRINNHDEIINIFDISTGIIARTGITSKNFEYVYKDNKYSYKLEHSYASSSEFRINLDSLALQGIQEFDIAVYVEDYTKVTNVELQLLKDIGSWTRSSNNLQNGWNYIRLACSDGDISTWNTVNTLRVIAYCSDPTTLYFGGIYAVKPNKAKIIVVNDHGYSGFKNIAYPKLKELGVPVTWGINPGRLGQPVSGATSILSQSEVDELALDPYSEFSFHAWDASEQATSEMTADELKTETHKCIHYLKKEGLLPKYLWRCAFVQNKATNHSAIQEIIEAYATPREKTGFELYPFVDTYNINRTQIHSRTNEWFDNFFETLKKTHCTVVVYTHDISDNAGIHMTNSELNYFVSKLQNAISEGWLEAVTYSQLRTRYEKDFGKKGYLDFYN